MNCDCNNDRSHRLALKGYPYLILCVLIVKMILLPFRLIEYLVILYSFGQF